MPSVWRIRKVKGGYYLYHRNRYIGPLEEIVRVYEEYRQAPEAGFEPAREDSHQPSDVVYNVLGRGLAH